MSSGTQCDRKMNVKRRKVKDKIEHIVNYILIKLEKRIRLNSQAQAEAHKDKLKPMSVITSDIGGPVSLLQSSTHTPHPGVRKIPLGKKSCLLRTKGIWNG